MPAGPQARVATWNVEWASPRSSRGEQVAQLIEGVGADVFVLTEGSAALLPDSGYVIDGGDDWGYGVEVARRKVIAWSRTPWSDVRTIDAPSCRGRVVFGRTETPIGPLGVVAVCIPWRDAHVRSGRRSSAPWSEHLACCEALEQLEFGPMSVLAGDFNQRFPRHREPIEVAAALDRVLRPLHLCTGGTTSVGRLIDHVAVGAGIRPVRLETWAGSRLSDHAGVVVDLGPDHSG